jgi:2-oxoglutarate ferredoxin oxidoreductase subunit alpha
MNGSNQQQPSVRISGDVSIVLAGAAGQGIQTIEYILARVLRFAGYNVFSCSEFMSRIRGGSNSTQIRVTAKKTASFVNRIDILIPFDTAAIVHCEKRITDRTLILGEKDSLATHHRIVDCPFTKAAQDAGGKLFAGSVGVGVVCGLFGIEKPALDTFLAKHFAQKDADVVQKNIVAAGSGLDMGKKLAADGVVSIGVDKDQGVSEEWFMTGAEAIALGAFAGGCDFVASYPMSPSTNVLQFMEEHKKEFGIVVEQAEDEIAALTMALGAWYAGGRGFATTSGGGFALMCESVSLAGMIESPAVVHVGQRPGPATGLPTRTEQGDLDLVLYCGHGEFPRAIFAPGSIDSAFKVMQKAFDIADKYQVPCFVLTDQFFLDSSSASKAFEIPDKPDEKQVVATQAGYKRYALTENGVSPRGVPGNGDGIVCCGSDEHTEMGYITEDLDLRVAMVDKRLKKLRLLEDEALVPRFLGPENFKTLVVCWGSNFSCVNDSLGLIGNSRMAMLHVTQLYPLHLTVKHRMGKAEKVIVVENNATGQFARLLTRETGFPVHESVLKYNGAPFSVEELVSRLSAAAVKTGT